MASGQVDITLSQRWRKRDTSTLCFSISSVILGGDSYIPAVLCTSDCLEKLDSLRIGSCMMTEIPGYVCLQSVGKSKQYEASVRICSVIYSMCLQLNHNTVLVLDVI